MVGLRVSGDGWGPETRRDEGIGPFTVWTPGWDHGGGGVVGSDGGTLVLGSQGE